jgi:acyl carrier protein
LIVKAQERLLSYVNDELLAERNLRAEFDTPLFADGWIDSLSILKLIAYVELLIGREIPDQEIVMENFRTIDTIASHFGVPA